MKKQKTLTPFEQAEYNRQIGSKRMTGIIIASMWTQRKQELRTKGRYMKIQEKEEWDQSLAMTMLMQIKQFGYDA